MVPTHIRNPRRWLPTAMLLALAAPATLAQSAPAKTRPCNPTESSPCGVADQFPFPGETSSAPAKGTSTGSPAASSAKDQFPYPGEAPESPKPAAPGAAKDSSATDQFPYPGEGTPSSSSSSSSSSDNPGPTDPNKPALKDEGSEGDTAPQRRRRLRPQAQKILSDDERVQEDLSVAHFYEQSGNPLGAYQRAKDAVKLQPNSADTHMALALAADKLAKRDEAIAEYNAALAIDPDMEGSKAARKALEKLKH